MSYRRALAFAFEFGVSLSTVRLGSRCGHIDDVVGIVVRSLRSGVGVFGCGKGSSTEVSQIATGGIPTALSIRLSARTPQV